jgi:cell division protein FtsQ
VNAKRTIRKILFVALWLAIGSGMLTLLIAAVSKQKRDSCKDYTITIKGDQSANVFLDKGAITKLLKEGARGSIKGQSKMSFDLQQMETLLENNVWIKDAQLYFDNQAVLHVTIEEREPVARVFTIEGRSFYIDKDEKLMPLSDKVFTRVPVFTDFPDRKKLTKEDSALVHGINITAQYISSHPFWTSQIAQTDIVTECGAGCWEFEMTPVVGNHIIRFGSADDIDGKFNRLLSFYQQVLSRTGLDKYKTVDVRFGGQVVGGKSVNPKIDSVLLRKSVERFMQQASEMTDSLPPVLNPVEPRTDGI